MHFSAGRMRPRVRAWQPHPCCLLETGREAMCCSGKNSALVLGRRGSGFGSAMTCCVTLSKSLDFSGACVPKLQSEEAGRGAICRLGSPRGLFFSKAWTLSDSGAENSKQTGHMILGYCGLCTATNRREQGLWRHWAGFFFVPH